MQLTNEYLRSGGVQQIHDPQLLEDLINIKLDGFGNAIPDTVTTRANAFMQAILADNLLPPILQDNFISEYNSLVQKKASFDQTNIETEEQVDELFKMYENSNNFLFRGQRESKWRLYSTLQRFWVWDKINGNEEEYLEFLQKIVAEGKRQYENEINKILDEIHIDSINDVAILGYLQHHSCPTPLLDWTYKFNIAMFFGVDGLETNKGVKEIDNYFSVYYIDEIDFEVGGMRTLLSDSLNSVGKELKSGLIAKIAKDEIQRKEMEDHFNNRSFFDKKRIKGSGLISHMTKVDTMINIPLSYFSDKDIDTGIAFSITNSNNIKQQNGVFTWNSHYSKPLEIVGNEQYNEARKEGEPTDYRFCDCYNINKNLSNYIVEKLKAKNISPETVYPDKNIDARSIYNEVKNLFINKD